jgi:hypothetical protein
MEWARVKEELRKDADRAFNKLRRATDWDIPRLQARIVDLEARVRQN